MNKPRSQLILFTRFPEAGRVKTRLIPALGAAGAAALHRRLTLRTVRTARTACQALGADFQICYDGGSDRQMRHWLGDHWQMRRQEGTDLGQRMANAFEESFRGGAGATVIVGSDCPELTSQVIAAALNHLQAAPAVFGPALDGGYYLIGLRRPIPELFAGIPWGGAAVLAESLRILEGQGIKPALLDPLPDLDRPEDLPRWQGLCGVEEADLDGVSVVIPALNEAAHVADTIRAAHEGCAHEVFVVDGGSTDRTKEIAKGFPNTMVVESSPGRARQMNAGAVLATGNLLLFLHADTLLPAGWKKTVSEILGRTGVVAGAFRFRLAGDFVGRRFIEWTANVRSTLWQQPYGDQALFLRRSVFEELGGFADMALLEDYDLVRRLKRRGRLLTAAQPATTSGRRWQQLGFLRTSVLNKLILAGYHLGVSPDRLARLYRRS